MENETKCPLCEFKDLRLRAYDHDIGIIIASLKKENESQKSTIRNVFNDLECGYDNGMIQTKMKNKSYSTDKWGNPTEAET